MPCLVLYIASEYSLANKACANRARSEKSGPSYYCRSSCRTGSWPHWLLGICVVVKVLLLIKCSPVQIDKLHLCFYKYVTAFWHICRETLLQALRGCINRGGQKMGPKIKSEVRAVMENAIPCWASHCLDLHSLLSKWSYIIIDFM